MFNIHTINNILITKTIFKNLNHDVLSYYRYSIITILFDFINNDDYADGDVA